MAVDPTLAGGEDTWLLLVLINFSYCPYVYSTERSGVHIAFEMLW